MRGHGGCRHPWGVGGAVFNRYLFCFLAAFSPLVLEASDWVSAAKAALPSTVRVFALNPRTGETCESTGIVIDKKGLVLTTAHSVHGFSEISILIGDDLNTAMYDATISKISRTMDLALLQAEGLYGKADLPPIQINRQPVHPTGTPIAVIGNPLKAFRTMTTGIVSMTGDCQGSRYILFDAQIGKGSSGGPLINAQGELLGVVVEIITQNGANLGKALSTAEIDRFMGLDREGFLGVSAKKAKTGLSGYGLSEGLQVTAESRDTPFEVNDIIMTFKDYPMDSYDDLIRIVRREQPGSQVEATVLRNGDLKILKVDIVDCPVSQK